MDSDLIAVRLEIEDGHIVTPEVRLPVPDFHTNPVEQKVAVGFYYELVASRRFLTEEARQSGLRHWV